jgi:hypothetical protein
MHSIKVFRCVHGRVPCITARIARLVLILSHPEGETQPPG